MFAPKVAKPQTKTTADSTNSLAHQRLTLVAHRPSQGLVEQSHLLQHTIGNQAALRYLTHRLSNSTAKAPGELRPPEAARVTGEAPSRAWDFTKIPVFPPDRATRPQASSALSTLPLPGMIQRKLIVGEVNDPLEHEANRVADKVMRMPIPKPSLTPAPPQVSRKCASCEEEAQPLQTRRAETLGAAAGEAPDVVHEVLRAPGQPLDPSTRVFFEPRFGHDFSGVRIHADERTAISAEAMNAHAYTVGADIAFGRQRYQPDDPAGQRLLAHELTHVVQQRAVRRVPIRSTPVPTTACLVNNVIDETGAATATSAEYGLFVADMASGAVPRLQRTTKFDSPTVRPVWNMAEQVVSGGPAGRTWGVLNGNMLQNLADGAAAINRPDLGGRTTATGSECWVNTVPLNVGSAASNILTNGPWSTVTTKATLGQIFGRQVCVNAANPGSATLIVKGDPSDAEVAAHVRAHEAHHASDHRAAFNSTLLNWDIALTSAQSSQQVFSGADQPSCEAALFNAIGGSPDDAAAMWMNAYADAISVFHATPEGGPAATKNSRGDSDCNVVTADEVA